MKMKKKARRMSRKSLTTTSSLTPEVERWYNWALFTFPRESSLILHRGEVIKVCASAGPFGDSAREKVNTSYNCTFFHERFPYLTGKKIWSEFDQCWTDEIVYPCKQGCDRDYGMDDQEIQDQRSEGTSEEPTRPV